MKKYLVALLVTLSLSLEAQTITSTITMTNMATNGMTFTVNGTTFTWTNNPLPDSPLLIQTGTNLLTTETNFWNALISYPPASLNLNWNGSNVVKLISYPTFSLATTIGGNWASNSLFTNGLPATNVSVYVTVPPSLVGLIQQTNIASGIVAYLNSTAATNTVSMNAPALAGVSNAIVVATNGLVGPSITNGLATTAYVLSNVSATNAATLTVFTNTMTNTVIALIALYGVNPTNGVTVTNVYAILGSSNYANIAYVTAATNGLVTASVTNGLVGPSITNGLASIPYVTNTAILNKNGSGTNTTLVNSIAIGVTNLNIQGYVVNGGGGIFFPNGDTIEEVYDSTNHQDCGIEIGYSNNPPLYERFSAVIGGASNDVQAASPGPAYADTILGGVENGIFENASFCTILGGNADEAATSQSVMLGGVSNIIYEFQGYNDFIIGGSNNVISIPGTSAPVTNSYIIGRNVKVLHSDVLVWSDTTNVVTSATNDSVILMAANGVSINTNSASGNGLQIVGAVNSTGGFKINGVPVQSLFTNSANSPTYTTTTTLLVKYTGTGYGTNFTGTYVPFGAGLGIQGVYSNTATPVTTNTFLIGQTYPGAPSWMTNNINYTATDGLTNGAQGTANVQFFSFYQLGNYSYVTDPNGAPNATNSLVVSYSSLTITNQVNYNGSFTGNGAALTNVTTFNTNAAPTGIIWGTTPPDYYVRVTNALTGGPMWYAAWTNH